MDPLQSGDPQVIGSYRLEGRLGAGGMGTVFRGRTPGGRAVAVKLINTEHAGDPAFRARFAREADAARRVGGFHTAQVIDADPDAERPWMACAHISGPSLGRAVRERGPLEPNGLRALAAGLAEGLQAVHDCGLVHRDLKPGNIILADDGPRIIDFGIARAVDASTLTDTGAVLGTLSFMSPEQAAGRAFAATSDVFSLGSVLVFAGTGRSPFAAEAMGAVLQRILGEPPDLGRLERWPELRGLVHVIAECLDKDPVRRPRLARVLAEASAHGETPDTDEAAGAPPSAAPRSWNALQELATPRTRAEDFVRLVQGDGAPHRGPAVPAAAERHGPVRPGFVVCFAAADADYGRRLADHLSANGLPVLAHTLAGLDTDLRPLREQLRRALGVVVVMSPEAQESEALTRAILEGQRHSREFLPVLLRGRRHHLLAATWSFDAHDGALPGRRELDLLRGLDDRSRSTPSQGRTPAVRPDTLPRPSTPAAPGPGGRVSLERLRALLSDGELQHADLLTTALLLDVADRREFGWLRRAHGRRLSPELLADLEAVWSQATGGAHGFHAQRGRAPAGGGRFGDFQHQAVQYGWQDPGDDKPARYQDLMRRPQRNGFFPTLRNPQNERYPDWYDQWSETVRAVHLRIRDHAP